ncbi:MAG: ChaN family lipoprotein, partial [Alphaproteobacteria bacterium]
MTVLISATVWAMMLLSSLTTAFADGAEPWRNWQSPLQADDALVGKIWSSHEKRFVTPRLLADALTEAEFVLLGETHDNADHHRLQAWLIDRIAMHRKPTVVMEMI